MDLAAFLNAKAKEYENPLFIEADPICIPHRFSRKQDREIAGFFAAIFAWGNRTTIIRKSEELMALMDNSPHEFCLAHDPVGLKRILDFKHRTFTATDILYFISFFHHHYSRHESLESAFTRSMKPGDQTVESALTGFYHYFFSLDDVPKRTRKHIASPEKKATCKRLNMFLRWMVRPSTHGVDFGIWREIKPSQLLIPLDLHVGRVARKLGLLTRPQTDWQAVLELTERLRELDKKDPAKYDFALFALGVLEKF